MPGVNSFGQTEKPTTFAAKGNLHQCLLMQVDGMVQMWWTLLKVLDRDVSKEIRKRLTSLSDGIFSKIHHVEEDRVESTIGSHTLLFV
jgi:hypothetical protein